MARDRRSIEISPKITDPDAPEASTQSLLRGILDRLLGSIQTSINNWRRTNFDELVTSQKVFGFSFSSYEGVTRLRNTLTEEAGGSISLDDQTGEIKIESSADAESRATLETNRRVIYYSGGQVECGIGVRLPGDLPKGDQEARWGAFDVEIDNGAGFGVDSNGLFVWLRSGGEEIVKTYRDNWNVDPVDGSGPSGADLNTNVTIIYQIDIVWYGGGPIEWSIGSVGVSERGGTTNRRSVNNRATVHEYVPQENLQAPAGPSINQPNLPVSAQVDNTGTPSAYTIYVSGRQASVYSVAREQREFRSITNTVEDYDLQAGQGVWEPMIALRRKEVFQGGSNPTNAELRNVRFLADENASMRVIWGADVDEAGSAPWRDPDTWEDIGGDPESAVEMISVQDEGGLTASVGDGFQTNPFGIVRVPQQGPPSSPPPSPPIEEPVTFGRDTPLVVFVRQDSSDVPTISTIVNWAEEW